MTVKGIQIKNVYYMLAYAFKALRQGVYARVEQESFDHAEDLFAAILALGISHLLKRGLHRSYQGRNEDLAGLRGRVDISRSIVHMFNRRLRIACEFDEFTANNLFNQILKSTALALLRTGRVSIRNAADLKRVCVHLNMIEDVDIRHIRWTSLRYERNNQHYLMLMNLCRMIVDGLLMGERENRGKTVLREFLLDDSIFASLYENFVRGYYRVHYNLNSSAPHIAWDIRDGDETTLLPTMKSDVMLWDSSHALIIDTKFYEQVLQENWQKRSARNNHLYQIYAYVMNFSSTQEIPMREVSGMLLYAETGEQDFKPTEWNMGGHRIGVESLDLSKPFEEISESLKKIVRRYFPDAKWRA